MARPHRLTRRQRLLGLAIVALQLGAVGAIAAARADGSEAPASTLDRVTAQAVDSPVALPEVTPETTPPPVEVPTTVAAPPTTAAPAPAPAAARTGTGSCPRSPAARPPSTPATRVQMAYESSVPAAWRSAITVRFELIEGNTSWAAHDGTIQIGSVHANGSDALLRATVAHEFGHLVAFRYGSQAFNGAAPDGWPAYSSRPEEAWADCVSRALSGVNDPSHGLPACGGSSLSWTADWVGAGPGAHPRTGT